MIRQWFILGVLSLLTAVIFWDFINKAVLYDPLAEMESTEMAADEKTTSEGGFKPAWGKEILDKNLFSHARNSRIAPQDVTTVERVEPVIEKKTRTEPIPVINLSGIIENQYGELVAYIQKDNDEAVPLREGDRLDEFKVIEITDRSVKMLFRGEETVLTLTQIETLTR